MRRENFEGHPVTIQDVYEAIGRNARGSMDERVCIRSNGCVPGGRCVRRTVFPANTMALVCEFLGLRRWGSFGACPATNSGKRRRRTRGRLVMDCCAKCHTVENSHEKRAIENAIAGVAATGARQMQCLHLLAIATKRSFPSMMILTASAEGMRTETGGRFVAKDLYAAGGTALIAKPMIEAGFAQGAALTVFRQNAGRRSGCRQGNPGRKLCAKRNPSNQPVDW